MVMNKKSVIFTLISTILLSIILLTFLIVSNNQSSIRTQTANSEVQTLNAFIKAANEEYIPKVIELSGIQATRSIVKYIENTGAYLNPETNPDIIYDAIMKDGYFLETKQDLMFEEGYNYTLRYLFDEVGYLANLTGIDFNYANINSIDVYQEEPFYLTISLNVYYNISSKDQDTFFYYPNQNVTAKIPLYNFRDPARIIENENLGLATRNVTIFEAKHQEWNESALISDIETITYVASTTAPSFLQRLTGQLSSPSPYGIASFINTRYYANPNHYTTTDYYYFTENSEDNQQVYLDDYPDFYLTGEYLIMYGLLFPIQG